MGTTDCELVHWQTACSSFIFMFANSLDSQNERYSMTKCSKAIQHGTCKTGIGRYCVAFYKKQKVF